MNIGFWTLIGWSCLVLSCTFAFLVIAAVIRTNNREKNNEDT